MGNTGETKRSIEEILDTIGDEYARQLLLLLADGPRSAKDLGEECDLSLPTVYRRMELLTKHELAKEKTMVAADGNHYRMYEINFDSTVISLSDDEFDVRIYRTENLPDRFDDLWEELSQLS